MYFDHAAHSNFLFIINFLKTLKLFFILLNHNIKPLLVIENTFCKIENMKILMGYVSEFDGNCVTRLYQLIKLLSKSIKGNFLSTSNQIKIDQKKGFIQQNDKCLSKDDLSSCTMFLY